MPNQPRSTEDILREMEEMAQGSGSDSPAPSGKSSGGGLKSFLDFFVKVVPEETEEAPKAAAPKSKSAATPPTPAPGPASAAPPRSSARVGDLVAGEPAPKFAPPKTDADLSTKPFDEIYKEAGVTGSPCSVDELATLMENPAVANQPLSVKIIAVNLALSAKGIGHDAPIADAVRRDRALDAFQAMLNDRAHAAEQRNLARIQQLTQETEEYLKRKQAEMDALRSEIAEAKRQSLDFSVRREAEEKRLANLIAPFLEGKPNPVTISN
ncbi:MAG TPA: hypothetical protein VJ810_17835 [Blastocatellia bacterium]|nr:hypothetical protein [Blastocatellia bacterium]